MLRLPLLLLLVLGGACAPSPRPASVPAEATRLGQLYWLLGGWEGASVELRYREVNGAIYGVQLGEGSWGIQIIDDSDDTGRPAPISLSAFLDGRTELRYALRSATDDRVEFEDEAHHHLRVARTPTGFRRERSAAGHPDEILELSGATIASAGAPEAEDRRFAEDTATEGAAGWARHFAGDGAMWQSHARIEGPAIRERIGKTLAAGKLSWAPEASGARGDLGYTLGRWAFAPATAPGGPPGNIERGSYCTIWQRGTDGIWRVLFDVGRPADQG